MVADTLTERAPRSQETAFLGLHEGRRVHAVTKIIYETRKQVLETYLHVFPAHRWDLLTGWHTCPW